MENKSIKKIVFISFFFLLLFVSVAYSALSSKMLLSGEVNLRPYKDIRVTGIKMTSSQNDGYEIYSSKYNSESITTSIKLPNINSTVSYEINITNNSEKDMKLAEIVNQTYNNSFIEYRIIGISLEDIIKQKSTSTFTIIYQYKKEIVLPEETSLSAIIKFVFADVTEKKYQEVVLNGAYPVFEEGLIPITIENDGTVKIADLYSDWYSYVDKKWANSIVPQDYEIYRNAPPGTVIDPEHIIAYLVWIPRYQYKDFLSDKESVIDIKFLDKTKDSEPGYKIPESFHVNKDGKTNQLSGFWMSKFQVSSNPNKSVVMSIPSVDVLRGTSLKLYYEYGVISNNNFLYGNPNSFLHLVKNSEWGSVAYLSNSIYGFCSSTACTMPSKNATFQTGMYNAQNDYKSPLGLTTSTTLNIYGVYDMIGCGQEMTLGTNDVNIIGVPGIDAMFYDDYKNNEYFYGDATIETKNWYGNSVPPLGTTYNSRLYVRGGNRYEVTNIFFVKLDSGSGGINNATRYVLTIIE